MKQITTTFNIYSTLALIIIWSIFEALFSEHQNVNTLIDDLTNSVFLKTLIFICLFVLAAMITSKVFKEIWNRFICNVFDKRKITLNESYAVCFLITLVSLQ